MPDLNDYHAFTSTSSGHSGGSGSNGSSSGGGNEGCAGTFVWVFAIVSLLWIIAKLTG